MLPRAAAVNQSGMLVELLVTWVTGCDLLTVWVQGCSDAIEQQPLSPNLDASAPAPNRDGRQASVSSTRGNGPMMQGTGPLRAARPSPRPQGKCGGSTFAA